MHDAGLVKEIERLAKENELKILKDEAGREYFSKGGKANPPPTPGTLELSTLDGLTDLIVAEGLDCGIFIAGPRTVTLRGALDEKWRQREVFARATVSDNGFPFEREMSIEDFIINVQCNFQDNEEKKKVIDLVSSITASEVTTADDDGIAQEVVTKAAIGHKKSKVQLDPIVTLVPYRTFREVAQPSDKFLLRMHPQEGCLPRVSLRSAGGDMWENEAIGNVYEYLKGIAPEGVAVIR
jgi:hypothetical protein